MRVRFWDEITCGVEKKNFCLAIFCFGVCDGPARLSSQSPVAWPNSRALLAMRSHLLSVFRLQTSFS